MAYVEPGEKGNNRHGRKDEARSGNQQARKAGPEITDVKHHLGGVRTRNQVGRSQHIEETLRGDPSPALNDLVFEHGNVRSWPTKA